MTVRGHLTYANITATLALVVAVGAGGAYAMEKLPKNSVGAKQIKSNAVKSAEIKAGAVGSAEIADGAVRSAEIASGSVTSVDLASGVVPAVLWARVSPNGVLFENSGAVSAVREDVGEYMVTFERDIYGCAFVASAHVGQQADFRTTSPTGASIKVHAEVPDEADVPQDSQFFLVVIC